MIGTAVGMVGALTGAASLTNREAARRSVRQDRSRLMTWFGADTVFDLPDRDPSGYLLVRLAYGPLLGVVMLLVLIAGSGYAGWSVVLLLSGRIPLVDGFVSLIVAAIAIYLAIRLAVLTGRWDVQLALRTLGSDETVRRVHELQRTRADVVAAIDDERRRIERAIHDDVQQRAVALALELGRARRKAQQGDDGLLDNLDTATAQAGALLTHLREVAWRIYPATLDEHGLVAALEGLSARTYLPVELDLRVDAEPPLEVAAAAYYVAAESVTNASKHSGAEVVTIAVNASTRAVTISATDNGIGGAAPSGSGLTSLRRRVAALDGTLSISSPSGGPTVVEARIPCE
ncbi:sensor histidine kinase [Rhodococcus sp. NPDC058521]|uniref:sensor histidine kinase n=1 Tax=Rhodococcus sp. NPDC058521 TaxID=3346536 RepID=UPI003662AFD8